MLTPIIPNENPEVPSQKPDKEPIKEEPEIKFPNDEDPEKVINLTCY